ncbi:HSP20-like chaperone [Amylocarpus encephaloides]|uniref:HSP20-like chaperone n=1 Tax=Amylocarpus encephaloides TaxID=45428 RepID=A0A9P7YUA1_9HELO|nr:HSP20-like chaperone [Amylocarpus encephaloides]
MAATPEVLWAQRSSATDAEKNYLYVTITVPDVQPVNLKLDVQTTSLKFAGHSDSLKRDYAIDLELYGEIDIEHTKVNHTAKNVQLVLQKKELKEEFWPRLLKEAKKVHFLKTDFDKWVDEDEQDEAPEDDPAAAGGMGGMGGMPGMGDMSSMMGGAGGDFGGIDFSKLGGAGMGGADDAEEGDEEDEDEDMPELEEDGEAAASSSKPKIEEVK